MYHLRLPNLEETQVLIPDDGTDVGVGTQIFLLLIAHKMGLEMEVWVF